MSRRTRLGALVAATLVVGVAGSALATRAPDANSGNRLEADEAEPTPAAEDLAHARDRLGAAGVEIDEATLADLAAAYGVGGATRIAAWAADPGDDITIDSIRSLRDGDGTEGSGMGWGQIARELGVHPGLGGTMGNGGGNGDKEDRPDAKDDGNGNGNGNGPPFDSPVLPAP